MCIRRYPLFVGLFIIINAWGCQSPPASTQVSSSRPAQSADGWVPKTPYDQPPAKPDAGAKIVLRFYEMLLSDQPPTVADEREIFCEESMLAIYLKSTGKKNDPTPLCNMVRRESHKYRAKKVFASGLPAVGVTNIYQGVSTLDGPRSQEAPGNGYVLAFFYDESQDKQQQERVVRFRIKKNKIDLDWTHTGYWYTESLHQQTIPIYTGPHE